VAPACYVERVMAEAVRGMAGGNVQTRKWREWPVLGEGRGHVREGEHTEGQNVVAANAERAFAVTAKAACSACVCKKCVQQNAQCSACARACACAARACGVCAVCLMRRAQVRVQRRRAMMQRRSCPVSAMVSAPCEGAAAPCLPACNGDTVWAVLKATLNGTDIMENGIRTGWPSNKGGE